MNKRREYILERHLKVIICVLYVFISSIQLLKAQTSEEVVLRFVLNKDVIGKTKAQYTDDGDFFIYLNDFLDVLGCPYQFSSQELTLNTCCPDTLSCFNIKDTLLFHKNEQLNTNNVLWLDKKPYLEVNQLSRCSSLPLKAHLNSLLLVIDGSIETPAIKLLKIEKKRNKQVAQMKQNSEKADVIPLRNLHINSLGYSVTNQLQWNRNYYLNINSNVNGELLKGSFNANYIVYPTSGISPRVFTFGWDKTDIDIKYLKRLSVFRSYSRMIMTTTAYNTGVFISNDGCSKIGFQNFLLTGKTSSNTIVEIYRNEQLISIITSDDEGNYEQRIDVGRGNNNISTVTYDNYGNAFKEHKIIFIPTDLQQKDKLSYRFSSGLSDDKALFTHALLDYGLTKYITILGRVEMITREKKVLWLPVLGVKSYLNRFIFIEANYMPHTKLVIHNGVYSRLFSMNFSYERYAKNQDKILNAPLERFQSIMNTRILNSLFRASLHLNIQNDKYQDNSFFSTNLGLNFPIGRCSSSILVGTNSRDEVKLINFYYGVLMQYTFNHQLNTEIKGDYNAHSKHISFRNRTQYMVARTMNSYLETSWSPQIKNCIFSVGFLWRFSDFHLRSYLRHSKHNVSTNINLSGSIVFEESNNLVLSNRMVSLSNLLIVPFLDKNGDGKYQDEEKILSDIKVTLKGVSNQVIRHKKGITFNNITPYQKFRLVVPVQSFEDISWRLEKKTFNLILALYQSKTIYFPISVVSEIYGTVRLKTNLLKSVNHVAIEIRNMNNNRVYKGLVDERGYYNVEGLTCGEYVISLDPEILKKKNLKIVDKNLSVKRIYIPCETEGYEYEDIDFIVE